jgi:hypothetical protein
VDIGSYRLNERLANAAIPSWRLKAIHGAHIFAAAGFPLRVDSTDELVNLLDTMQENRYQVYLRELGGLDDSDQAALVDALVDYCLFFRSNFAGGDAVMPVSTMIAHLALSRKLRGLGARRILEIGPGCGYLSFFLKARVDLESYSQIETAESFYLLQNLVNKHVFGHRFCEYAQSDWSKHAASPILEANAYRGEHLEISPRIRLSLPQKCFHYPWWRLGDLVEKRFDVVTSNANLNEFSRGAFDQYVWLIDRVLEQDGCLLVQCPGGGPLPMDYIFQQLLGKRLMPIAMVAADSDVPGAPRFAVANFLFVREKHRLFARYSNLPLAMPRFDAGDPLIRDVYLATSNRARLAVSPEQLVAAVAERLNKL